MSSAACVFTGPRRAWEDEIIVGVSDSIAVRTLGYTEGCMEESCCSWAAGSVEALATAEVERWRSPQPAGSVWATQATQHLAQTRRVSAMEVVE